jgi:predicted nucleic acid-binding protein
MSPYGALIDSDAFIALLMPDDALHGEAMRIYTSLKERGKAMATTNLVVAETATVLSHRARHKEAIRFLQRVKETPTIFIDETMTDRARRLFAEQTVPRRVSMVDCANAIAQATLHIEAVFSFDQFYRHNGIPYAT